jgi:polyisoprenoid-binding protein YceI
MIRAALTVLFGIAVMSFPAATEGPCVVPGRGHFHVRTGTGGLFGAFAHDHLIEAQGIEGCAQLDANDAARSSIKLTFRTADIRVMDPKESSSDRAKVQKTMEAEVLRVAEYPVVVFESTKIEPIGAGDMLRVHGSLTIRGRTQPVIVPVIWSRLADGSFRATGEYKFKQTSYGIEPIKLAGGAVKVKDEVRTDFELFLK